MREDRIGKKTHTRVPASQIKTILHSMRLQIGVVKLNGRGEVGTFLGKHVSTLKHTCLSCVDTCVEARNGGEESGSLFYL